jgi:hypothetical protein
MSTKGRGKKAEKPTGKMGLMLQEPYEVLPGVVSYPLRVEEIRGPVQRLRADQSFVQSLMKRLVPESRPVRG